MTHPDDWEDIEDVAEGPVGRPDTANSEPVMLCATDTGRVSDAEPGVLLYLADKRQGLTWAFMLTASDARAIADSLTGSAREATEVWRVERARERAEEN